MSFASTRVELEPDRFEEIVLDSAFAGNFRVLSFGGWNNRIEIYAGPELVRQIVEWAKGIDDPPVVSAVVVEEKVGGTD